MKEIWKNIPGISTNYSVSNLGRVMNCGRILQSKSSKGQDSVCLPFKGKIGVFEVRQLIAYAFLDYDIFSMRRPQLIHKDGNIKNIHLDNLAIADNSSLPDEIWRDVAGFEEYYQVSNLGRIKRNERFDTYIRTDTGKECTRIFPEKIMKQSTSHDGYKQIEFRTKENHRYANVHRVVAEAFIPNPDKKPQINHIDGVRDNNKVENLEWCTCRENIQDQIHRSGRDPLISVIRKKQGVKVKCLETQTVYPSLGVPAKLLKTSGAAITDAISRGTCIKGWTFVYPDQLESLGISEKEYCCKARQKYFSWPRAAVMEVNGWKDTFSQEA